jgi:hypothetical protein
VGKSFKITQQDIQQMSDSQRIMFNAGRAFELERIIKLLRDVGCPESTIAIVKGDR